MQEGPHGVSEMKCRVQEGPQCGPGTHVLEVARELTWGVVRGMSSRVQDCLGGVGGENTPWGAGWPRWCG